MNEAGLRELLKLSIRLSLEAGKEILRIYEGENSVDKKSDDSPLTLADISSHRIISDGLSSTDIPLLSEEGKDISYEVRRNWQYFWLIDPLDGTKEFIKRNGEFTVNIALIHASRPVLGIIYAPVMRLLYYALKGEGAYKTLVGEDGNLDKIISGAQRLPLYSRDILSRRIVASRSHMSAETEAYIIKLKDKFKEVSFLSAGSSLKFCLIAEGSADIYPRFGPTMEWDTAAGQIIVEEAGGTVLEVETGQPLVYNKRDLKNPYFIVRSHQSLQDYRFLNLEDLKGYLLDSERQ